MRLKVISGLSLREGGPRLQTILIYGAAKIGPGLIMFAAVPIWIRLFGVDEYGLYAICWASALFSSSFFT